MEAQSWDDKYMPSLHILFQRSLPFPWAEITVTPRSKAKEPSVSGKAHGVTEDRVQEAGAE